MPTRLNEFDRCLRLTACPPGRALDWMVYGARGDARAVKRLGSLPSFNRVPIGPRVGLDSVYGARGDAHAVIRRGSLLSFNRVPIGPRVGLDGVWIAGRCPRG